MPFGSFLRALTKVRVGLPPVNPARIRKPVRPVGATEMAGTWGAAAVQPDLWVRVTALYNGKPTLVKIRDHTNPYKISSLNAENHLWAELFVKGLILEHTGAIPLSFDLSHAQ